MIILSLFYFWLVYLHHFYKDFDKNFHDIDRLAPNMEWWATSPKHDVKIGSEI